MSNKENDVVTEAYVCHHICIPKEDSASYPIFSPMMGTQLSVLLKYLQRYTILSYGFLLHCSQILLPVPLLVLRLPLPVQWPVQQPCACHLMAIYPGKHALLHRRLR